MWGGMLRGRDCEERKEIDSEYFSVMLKNAAKKMMNLGGAKPGDKTILDSEDYTLAGISQRGNRDCSGTAQNSGYN